MNYQCIKLISNIECMCISLDVIDWSKEVAKSMVSASSGANLTML